jgi:hypothetical protein
MVESELALDGQPTRPLPELASPGKARLSRLGESDICGIDLQWIDRDGPLVPIVQLGINWCSAEFSVGKGMSFPPQLACEFSLVMQKPGVA